MRILQIYLKKTDVNLWYLLYIKGVPLFVCLSYKYKWILPTGIDVRIITLTNILDNCVLISTLILIK